MTRRRLLWLGLLLAVAGGVVAADYAGLLPSAPRPAGPVRGPTPAGPLQVVWTFEPPPRGGVLSSPLVAGECVYVAASHDTGLLSGGAVYCLSRDTGRPVWTFDAGGTMQQPFSSPCLAGGRLYVGEGMHRNFVCKLYCLDAATGRECWHFEAQGHVESSPCVVDGLVYFGAGDDGVYCLEAATGKERWHYEAPIHVDSSPAVEGGRVYAGSGVSLSRHRTEAFCLDARTGAVLWRLPTNLPVWGSPAVDGREVYFGLGNGRYSHPPPPPEKPAGAVLCVDADAGRERWRRPTPDAVFCRPALDGPRVFVGCRDGCCWGLDRYSGAVCWQAQLGSAVFARPAPAGTRVYALSSAGRLCRLDAETGEVHASFDVAAHSKARPEVFSSPALEHGPDGWRIYFGTELKNAVNSAAVVYCLRDD
jgi:outer membrane protein assembly factor BamB